MFVDELNIRLRAGKGGDGVERWRHEKFKEFGGPSGGNGGKGGDVVAVAVSDIGILASYRNVKELSAGNGENGGGNSRQGGEGVDIEIKVPAGSRITNHESGHSVELLNSGDKAVLLKGGRGGLGNEHFKSSINVRPKESTPGELGEEADFTIELLLAVDVGIIGLPNAGKSSLLNTLTAARSKVGDFPFTTIEPALGSFYGVILADIPGLIEGAAAGKGLGHKFLRHIERTKNLLHCVSSESNDVLADYQVVRNELALYNKDMLEKPETIVLTKTDLVSEARIEEMVATLKKANKDVVSVSVLDDISVKKLGDHISQSFSS